MAAVIGKSSYGSPYSVWCEKTSTDEVVEDNGFDLTLEAGKAQEPVCARAYELETGRVLEDPGDFTIVTNEQWPWLGVTPDRLFMDGDRLGALEMKTTGFHKARDWRHQLPGHVAIQLASQMMVLEADMGSAVCMIGNLKIAWKDVEPPTSFYKTIQAHGERFWREHVEKRIPPEIDHHRATREAVRRETAAIRIKDVIELPEEFDRYGKWLDEIDEEMSLLKDRGEAIRNRLMSAIGDHESGKTPEGREWTYKANKNGVRSLRRVT